jgi:hypothetical protein
MSRKLRNVTVTLEEEVARWARIEAARKETSVSRLLGQMLKARMLEEDGYEGDAARAVAETFSENRRALYVARGSA